MKWWYKLPNVTCDSTRPRTQKMTRVIKRLSREVLAMRVSERSSLVVKMVYSQRDTDGLATMYWRGTIWLNPGGDSIAPIVSNIRHKSPNPQSTRSWSRSSAKTAEARQVVYVGIVADQRNHKVGDVRTDSHASMDGTLRMTSSMELFENRSIRGAQIQQYEWCKAESPYIDSMKGR